MKIEYIEKEELTELKDTSRLFGFKKNTAFKLLKRRGATQQQLSDLMKRRGEAELCMMYFDAKVLHAKICWLN